MKNNMKTKKLRMARKAEIRKRNQVGLNALLEEIEARWDACEMEINEYCLLGRETGEHIDYDAVEDMCVSNAERDIENIKYKYWKMGLPEELVWE